MKALTSRIPLLAGALLVLVLLVYSYRELPGRSFAADDFQWLLNVQGLSLTDLLARSLDPFAQQHFYRPMVWLLIWGQVYLYGLDPGRLHWVSLWLHGLNALLVGWLALRLVTGAEPQGHRTERSEVRTQNRGAVFVAFLVPMLIVALHPALFEAVVWISAQSELLGAALLLSALHLWLVGESGHPVTGARRWGLAALSTAALGLAMLTKESAALGLPLMVLLTLARGGRPARTLALPTLLTVAFVALQLEVARQNTALGEGRYGFGWQLIANPLRSLALVAAPLPGTEHADNSWLVPAGALVLLLLGLALVVSLWRARRAPGQSAARPAALVAALLLTLLPTAPFLSPPDSRYLYLPVAFAGILLAQLLVGALGHTARAPLRGAWWYVPVALALVAAAWWAVGEVGYREWSFSAGSGPGGSLWRLTREECAPDRALPRRMILVDPPIAGPHVAAIVALSCGAETRVVITGRDGVEGALRDGSVVVAFPGGSAAVEQRS